MKVSVCVTVFNEEKSIVKLLNSLLSQTKRPNEIVIVDGGSIDKTVGILRHFAKKDKRIRFLVEPGSCAHGRNVSISLARNKIVALTDAGCVAKKDWLKRITEPFKYESVDLVAGFYEMPANTPLQEVLNVFNGVPEERFDSTTFLPSARSVAFRKEVWEEVGGFDEKLDKAGEDTKFFYECVKAGVKIVRVKEARVVWKETGEMNLRKAFEKFYQYAKGDAQAGIWWHPSKQLSSHNIKILFIYVRYILGLSFLMFSLKNQFYLPLVFFLIFLYLFWSIWKWRDVIKGWGRFWLPVIQVLSDFAVMTGFTAGMVKWRNRF